MKILNEQERKALVDGMTEISKKFVEDRLAEGNFTNTVFILKDGKGIGIPFNFSNQPGDKDAHFNAMNHALKEHRPDCAAFISECWFLGQKELGENPDLDNTPLPSQSPDRREAYSIIVRTHGYVRHVLKPFVRLKDGSIQFEEEMDSGNEKVTTIQDRLFHGVFLDDMQTIGGMQ